MKRLLIDDYALVAEYEEAAKLTMAGVLHIMDAVDEYVRDIKDAVHAADTIKAMRGIDCLSILVDEVRAATKNIKL